RPLRRRRRPHPIVRMPQPSLSRARQRSLRIALFTAIVFITATAVSKSQSEKSLADSFQKKLDHIQSNAKATEPSTTPTLFEEDEVNAYFAQRRLKVPDGVEKVRFHLRADEVTGYTKVDFEEFRKSRPDSNPLLAIFDGVHDCEVVARTDESAN